MPIETATYLSDLVVANPTGTDPISEGDNHIRLLKTVIKNTLPNINAPITATPAELNKLTGMTSSKVELNYLTGLTAAVQTQLDYIYENAQPLDPALTSLSGLVLSADKLVYATAADTYTLTPFTPFARTLLDDADAVAMKATLQMGVLADQNTGLTVGITNTAVDDGDKASGTYTPSPVGGNMKRIRNLGAFTMSAPVADGDYTLVIQLSNATGAGAVTLSGFTKVTGDSLTTVATDKFLIFITKVNGFVSAVIQSLT